MFQLQQEEEQKIRDRAANEAALAAIGSGTKRKRLSAAGPSDGAAPVSALLMLLACPPSSVQLYNYNSLRCFQHVGYILAFSKMNR